MKKLSVNVLAMALVVTMSSAALAAEKVAVVDLERVMKSLKETKVAEELLERNLEEIKLEKDKTQRRLDEERAKLEKLQEAAENPMLSDAVRKQKQEEFMGKLNDYRRLELDARKELAKKRQDLEDRGTLMSKKIVGGLRKTIAEYAADKKIDLVLDKGAVGMAGAESVLFASDKLDITDAILKMALDKEAKE